MMSEPEKTLALPSRLIEEFVPSVVLKLPDGDEIRVPVNAEANQIESQVIAAKARRFINRQLDMIESEDTAMEANRIKDLILSIAKVEEVARFAYAPGLEAEYGGESKNGSALSHVKAMAEGMTNAVIASDDRKRKILELGREKKPKIIDAEEAS